MAASLFAVLESGSHPHLDLVASPELAALIGDDADDSGQIATQWRVLLVASGD